MQIAELRLDSKSIQADRFELIRQSWFAGRDLFKSALSGDCEKRFGFYRLQASGIDKILILLT